MSATTDIKLRQMALDEVARIEAENARAEAEEEAKEREARRFALYMLLKERLGVETAVETDRITIDGLTFTARRQVGPRRGWQLVLLGTCPHCGEETGRDIYTLYELGKQIERFDPDSLHIEACSAIGLPPQPNAPSPAETLAHALAALLQEYGYLGGEP